jgi:hypothetical protein
MAFSFHKALMDIQKLSSRRTSPKIFAFHRVLKGDKKI